MYNFEGNSALHFFPISPFMSNIRVQAIDASYAQVLCDEGRKIFKDTFGPDNDPANMEAYLEANYSKDLQQKELEDPLCIPSWPLMVITIQSG